MNTYSLDDAIELLLAYRDRVRQPQSGGANADGDGYAAQDVRVMLQLTLCTDEEPQEAATGPSTSAAARQDTAGRLTQWWMEGLSGTAPTRRAPDDEIRHLVAPSSSSSSMQVPARVATAVDSMHPAAAASQNSYAALVEEGPPHPANASTYEVPSPMPSRRVYGHEQQQLYASGPAQPLSYPVDYGHLPPAAHYFQDPGQPPHRQQQQQRRVVVRSQPNMRKERAGQNGISWVIH